MRNLGGLRCMWATVGFQPGSCALARCDSATKTIPWLLRAAQLDGFGVEFPSSNEPLSAWHMEENRTRISTGADGEYSLACVRERHHLLTPNAYGAFILWMVSYNAAKVNDCRAFWLLLPEARWYGRVRPFDLLTHVAY